MTCLTDFTKLGYSTHAPAKSGVGIDTPCNTGDTFTPNLVDNCVIFCVHNTPLLRPQGRNSMVSCVGEPQGSPFPVYGSINPAQLATHSLIPTVGEKKLTNTGIKAMSNTAPVVSINNTSVSVINYQGLPVITTAMLSDFYGTESIRIQQNHNENKDRFVEGKHFFKLEGEALRDFKKAQASLKLVSGNARHFTLWTERGAARHAKMLDTDQAWEVFEKLEDSYFGTATLSSLSNLATPEQKQQVKGLLHEYVRMTKKTFQSAWNELFEAAQFNRLENLTIEAYPKATAFLNQALGYGGAMPKALPQPKAKHIVSVDFDLRHKAEYRVVIFGDGRIKRVGLSCYEPMGNDEFLNGQRPVMGI